MTFILVVKTSLVTLTFMRSKSERPTLRAIAESPREKSPAVKTITGGFWLLLVDRRLSREPLLFTVGIL
jgi:hypothetical protein